MYADLGQLSNNIEEKVMISPEKVFCTLLQRQRTCQQILDWANYIVRHYGYDFSDVESKDSFDGPVPQWLEVMNVKEVIDFIKLHMSHFHGQGMVIRSHLHEEVPEIANLCSELQWKYWTEYEVTGSESSLVILYDFPGISYELLTRSKHHLLIVTETISGKK